MEVFGVNGRCPFVDLLEWSKEHDWVSEDRPLDSEVAYKTRTISIDSMWVKLYLSEVKVNRTIPYLFLEKL